MKLFIDGQPASTPQATASVLPNLSSNTFIAIGGNGGENGECDMNDVRIYDHALSQAEVKELSKALVVHYTFNDVLAEPTTNVSTINGWSSYTSYFVISERTETGLKLYRPTNSTNTVLALNNSAVTGKMTAGEIWTFSCFLYVDGKPYKCTQSDMSTYKYSGISYYSNDDGYYTCTFTVGAPETWIIHAPMFGSVGTNVMCEIDRIQFEKKDHATPYTPSTRASMIIDESGYDHPTILVNDCEFVTDTNSGTLALHTAGADNTASFGACSYLRADMKTSITPTAFTISMWAKINTWGKQTSGVLSLNTSTDPTGYLTSTFVQYDGNFRLNNSASTAQSSIGSGIVTLDEWHHYAFTWDGANLKGYKDGTLYSTAAAAFVPDPFQYIFLGVDRAGGAVRDADVTWGNFKIYMTALSAEDIKVESKARALITDKGDIEAHQFIEKTENIITEAEFAIPARSTAGNGKIELRNGVMAYGLQANTYYYAGDAESSNAIFKGKFKANTQYYFDLFMDVDTMWYSGGSKYVPGGFIVRYTDGTTVEVTTQSTDGANGWKRVQYYSNPDKSVYGLGIYYYIGTKWYLRHDSGIYEVDKDNAQVTSKYTAETTQVAETSFETNALIHSSGNVVGREIIEL